MKGKKTDRHARGSVIQGGKRIVQRNLPGGTPVRGNLESFKNSVKPSAHKKNRKYSTVKSESHRKRKKSLTTAAPRS